MWRWQAIALKISGPGVLNVIRMLRQLASAFWEIRSDAASLLHVLEHIQHAISVSVALSLFPAVRSDSFQYVQTDLVSQVNGWTSISGGPAFDGWSRAEPQIQHAEHCNSD